VSIKLFVLQLFCHNYEAFWNFIPRCLCFRSSTLKVLPSRFYLKGSTFFIDSGPVRLLAGFPVQHLIVCRWQFWIWNQFRHRRHLPFSLYNKYSLVKTTNSSTHQPDFDFLQPTLPDFFQDKVGWPSSGLNTALWPPPPPFSLPLPPPPSLFFLPPLFPHLFVH
jgi:hypothetical protein